MYGAQTCPYTLPSFNTNSSHGCRYPCCVDADSNPAPPLPPAPETHHPKLELLVFPSNLPLLQFSHLSEMAPPASILPVLKPQMGDSSFFLPPHIQSNTMSYWLYSQILHLSDWFYSHLQLKHHPSPSITAAPSTWRKASGCPQPSRPSAPGHLGVVSTLLCSEPSNGSHSRSYLTCPFLLSLTLTHSFSASPTKLHF